MTRETVLPYADWVEAWEFARLEVAASGQPDEEPWNACEHARTAETMWRCARHRKILHCDDCMARHIATCSPHQACGRCAQPADGTWFRFSDPISASVKTGWTGVYRERAVVLCGGADCGPRMKQVLADRLEALTALIDVLARGPVFVMAHPNQFTGPGYVCGQHPQAIHYTRDAMRQDCGERHDRSVSCDMCGQDGGVALHQRDAQVLISDGDPLTAYLDGDPERPVRFADTRLYVVGLSRLCHWCAWHWSERERPLTGLYASWDVALPGDV